MSRAAQIALTLLAAILIAGTILCGVFRLYA